MGGGPFVDVSAGSAHPVRPEVVFRGCDPHPRVTNRWLGRGSFGSRCYPAASPFACVRCLPVTNDNPGPVPNVSERSREIAADLSGGTLLLRGPTGLGSGVMVGDRVLTAFHVVRDSGTPLTASVGQDRAPLRFLAASPAEDIAILEVEKPVPLARVPRFVPTAGGHVGDPIWTCGYPYGVTVPIVRRGSIAATITPRVATVVDRPMFMVEDAKSAQHWIDVPVFPGNSGGPVVDAEGELIGLMLETHYARPENDGLIHLDLGVAVRLGLELAFTGLADCLRPD